MYTENIAAKNMPMSVCLYCDNWLALKPCHCGFFLPQGPSDNKTTLAELATGPTITTHRGTTVLTDLTNPTQLGNVRMSFPEELKNIELPAWHCSFAVHIWGLWCTMIKNKTFGVKAPMAICQLEYEGKTSYILTC